MWPTRDIEFHIQGNADYYLDLANTLLYVKAKITRADGTALTDIVQVAPVSLWMHTMFLQIDAYLNDKLVTPSSNTYVNHSYLETFNYGKEFLDQENHTRILQLISRWLLIG